jgi:hypothetical protein
MTIELSDLTFTELDDVIPAFGVKEVILNTGVANTLAGHDTITGVGPERIRIFSLPNYGIYNFGPLYTDEGNDTITGIYDETPYSLHSGSYNSTFNNTGSLYINNTGSIDDYIDDYYIDDYPRPLPPFPLSNYGILNSSTIATGEGDDIIIGINTAVDYPNIDPTDIYNPDNIGIDNRGTINTGNGNDSIISKGKFINTGGVFLGEGNDSISADKGFFSGRRSIENYTMIETGDGNDTITSYGVIYNEGTINTGDGNDSIITATLYGDFEGLGSVFLGNGKDYLKGFGSGDFNGGQDEDTLELTLGGSYTVGISGTAVSFTRGSSVMNTSEFEILIAGNTIYDFSSLTVGQIITVA